MAGTGDTNQLEQVREYFDALKNAGNVVIYGETENANHATMSYLASDDLRAEGVAWMNRFKVQKHWV